MLRLLLGSLLAAGAWGQESSPDDAPPPAAEQPDEPASDVEAAREAYQEALERLNNFAALHSSDEKSAQKLSQETELLRLRYERLEQTQREARQRRLLGDRKPEELVESLKDPSMLPAIGVIAALTLVAGGLLGLKHRGLARCPCGQRLRLPAAPKGAALRVRCPSCGQESVVASG